MRRCTGFKPSRTSGSARETITLIAYSRYERFISSEMLTGRISLGSLPPGWSLWSAKAGLLSRGGAAEKPDHAKLVGMKSRFYPIGPLSGNGSPRHQRYSPQPRPAAHRHDGPYLSPPIRTCLPLRPVPAMPPRSAPPTNGRAAARTAAPVAGKNGAEHSRKETHEEDLCRSRGPVLCGRIDRKRARNPHPRRHVHEYTNPGSIPRAEQSDRCKSPWRRWHHCWRYRGSHHQRLQPDRRRHHGHRWFSRYG